MTSSVYTKRTGWLPAGALLTILTTFGGCDRGAPPATVIGGIEVPEAVLGSLAEPERHMLADIVGFMVAIRDGATDDLIEPVVAREAAVALAEALPYGLAARDQGWNDDDLRAAYAQRPERELVVRHLVRLVESGASSAAHDSARRVAESAVERVRGGEEFARVAAELSEEPGAADRGGLLTPGRRGTWVDPFWSAAEALAPGQVSGVVRTPYGYHVLRLEEVRTVPFEEASQTALVLRAVHPGYATEALAEWEAGPGSIAIDAAAAAAAFESITAGQAVASSLVVARGADWEYRGDDLAAGWALLEPAARAEVERGGVESFRGWVTEDAGVSIRAAVAADLGLDTPADAIRAAETAWLRRVAIWSAAFGLAGAPPPASDAELLDRARQALLSGAPEARSARLELRSLRPRLRALYPATTDS